MLSALARGYRAILATREDEVDNLLRAETFVDLFSVVRHGIRASESYSIKKLEPLYSFARSVPLEDVGGVLARTPTRLEMADYQRSACQDDSGSKKESINGLPILQAA